ncbi:MAG: fructokinase [Geminicoccaceae bacterium]|nr:fructokinase [Geminicoccaceae bacterium]
MADVVCFGDLLIDFVPLESGLPLGEVAAFARAPGGAAANVAVGLARLGASSAFMGKVGDDPFGHYLADVLEKEGVDVAPLRFETRARTPLAFVSLRADGERDFMFYKHPSADHFFAPDEIDRGAIEAARIFHYDALTMIKPFPRATAFAAIEAAKGAGLTLSFDVNLRLPLWEGDEAGARAVVKRAFGHADVVKMSEEELGFLTEGDPSALVGELWHEGLRLVVITQGGQGCTLVSPNGTAHVPSIEVAPVDTTGAGDGFVAGLLKGLLDRPESLDDQGALRDIARFANVVGAITTTGRGAIPSLPRREQVERLLA